MRLRIPPLAGFVLLILGATNAWLLVTLLRDVYAEPQQSPVIVMPLPDLTEIETVQTASKSPATYSQTLAHPVFFKNRLPYVPPPPPQPQAAAKPAPPPAPPDPAIAMGGVAIDGAGRRAYLLKRGDAQGLWVGEGESFMGWTVQSIDSEGARLRHAERSLNVQLYQRR